MEKCNTEELYLLHRQRLLSLIHSKVEDAQKAEDLLHDSFIKLQVCCDRECECERPKSYLFRLVLNTVFDYFKRKKKIRPNLKLYESNIKESDKTLEVGKQTCDLMACITKFLNETSKENREAFEKVDLQQIPQVKVAKELNIPLSTLKSRVQRTRKLLKQKINSCCPNYITNCV